jgi:hypothetical protein
MLEAGVAKVKAAPEAASFQRSQAVADATADLERLAASLIHHRPFYNACGSCMLSE